MLAAYGVYGAMDPEDGGFTGHAQGGFPEHVVVVTSQRDGSTANTLMRTPRGGSGDVRGGWCWCKSADSPTEHSPWFRPTVLLTVLLLLLIVFLLISGGLVYFNRKCRLVCCVLFVFCEPFGLSRRKHSNFSDNVLVTCVLRMLI